MRKIVLVFILLLFVFMSCKKEKDTPSTPQPTPQLKVDSTSLRLSGNKGDMDSFTVQFSGNWSIAVNPSSVTWLKLSKSSGTGTTKIYVTVEQDNTNEVAQIATIVITPNGEASKAINIPVTQEIFKLNFNILWKYTIGGSANDFLSGITRTEDGGYIAVGRTTSNNGDFSGNKGQLDAWIYKMDANGSKQWQKLIGGSHNDHLYSITKSSDGNYVVVGQTNSNDGDIRGLHSQRAGTISDALLIKITPSGQVLWQKTLGGYSEEYMGYDIVATTDGGCVFAVTTDSNDGDVAGNHGDSDAWVVKLDTQGEIVWQKTLGGSSSDFVYSIIRSTDEGYVIAGWTTSNDGDVSGNHGSGDIWVVKLSADGNKLWQKTLGGTRGEVGFSIIENTSGNYIVVGRTSSNDGDVSGYLGGMYDIWVVNLNKSGNMVWQKTLGGTGAETGLSIAASEDGGCVIAGQTNSKEGNVSGFDKATDVVIVKVDGNGNKVWQKALGGSDLDLVGKILSNGDGSYLLTVNTVSNDGDMSGNHGGSDAWVIKFKAN